MAIFLLFFFSSLCVYWCFLLHFDTRILIIIVFFFADTSTGEHVSLKIDRVNLLAIKTKRDITNLPPYSGVHCVAPRGWFTIRVSTIVFLRGEWWCCKTDWWVRYVGISPVPTLTQNPASSRSLFSSIVYTNFRDLTVTYIIS